MAGAKSSRLLATIGMAMVGVCLTAGAAERKVPSQYSTIQAAIDAAITGDEVVVAVGSYSGAFNFGGKAITVRSTNPDDATVVRDTMIFSTSSNTRAFTFASGETQSSVLLGLTIRGGNITVSPYGGSILCQNSSPRIEKCVIARVYPLYTVATAYTIGLENSGAVFKQCRIDNYSGAFYVSGGSVELDRCIISGNIVNSSAGSALENAGGSVLLNNCCLNRNTGASGTQNLAIRTSGGGTVTIRGCTLMKNGKIAAVGGSRLNLVSTIIMPDGDSNRIQLSGGSLANVDYCAVTGLAANASIEAGSVLNWGAGNIDPGILQSMGENGKIKAGSVFVNAGDPAYIPPAGERDVAGNPRLAGGRVDIGCSEVPVQPIVLSPVEGEVFAAGSQRDIRWASGAQTVDIYYSTDGGVTWSGIVTGEPGTGSFRWTVPQADSANCLISAETVDNGMTVKGLSGQFTIKPYVAGHDFPSRWSTLGGSSQRSGLSEFSGPQTGCVSFAMMTQAPIYGGVVVGHDGTVYGVSETSFYRLKEDDGNMITLVRNLPRKATSSPTMGPDGTIYVGCEDGSLIALDGDGQARWTFKTGEMIIGAPATDADGRVFVGSADGTVYCLEQDGSELWEFSVISGLLAGGFTASPTMGVDGSVYVADSHKAVLYSLDPDDGSVLWTADFSNERLGPNDLGVLVPIVTGRLVAAPAVGPDGTIYLGFEGYSKLYAVDPNGTRRWSLELADITSGWFAMMNPAYPTNASKGYLVNGSAWTEAAVGPDGTIYVNMDDPYLRAVDPNGTTKWVRRVGAQGGFTLTAGADGLVYACSDDKSMYVLRPDGSIASLFNGEGWLSYPVVAEDGKVYVSDSAGALWTIKTDCPQQQESDLRRMWDVNGDRKADFIDFAQMAGGWLMTTWDYQGRYSIASARIVWTESYLTGDLNRDAYIDMKDIAVMAEWWLAEE